MEKQTQADEKQAKVDKKNTKIDTDAGMGAEAGINAAMDTEANTDKESTQANTTTQFGFKDVTEDEKTQKVSAVFSSVANKYDLMNDLMSFGLHRIWKRIAIRKCNLKPGMHVLDLAGGTGDLSYLIQKKIAPNGKVVLTDINKDMLEEGKKNLLDKCAFHNIEFVNASAEDLPFQDGQFDRVIIGFGLRNFTNKAKALSSIYRVLKPGGKLIILEFSKPHQAISPLYKFYNFNVLPKLGKLICKDEDSYRYLAESIEVHPDQEQLKQMMLAAKFDSCAYTNLTAGIVAIHTGYKL